MPQASETLYQELQALRARKPAASFYEELQGLRPPPKPTVLGGVAEAGRSVVRGVGSVAADLLAFPGTAEGFLLHLGEKMGMEHRQVGQAGRGLQQLGKDVKSVLPERRPQYARGLTGFATQDVPEAIGTSIAFLASAWATGGATGIGEVGSIAATGAAQAFTAGYEEVAERADISEEKKWVYALLQGGMGTSEAVPLGAMLARINRRSGGGVRKLLRTVATEMFEEGGQEGAQQVWGDFWRVQLTPDEYGPVQEEVRKLLQTVSVAAVSGGIMSGMSSGLAEALNKVAPEQAEAVRQPSPPPEAAPEVVAPQAPSPEAIPPSPAPEATTPEAQPLTPVTEAPREEVVAPAAAAQTLTPSEGPAAPGPGVVQAPEGGVSAPGPTQRQETIVAPPPEQMAADLSIEVQPWMMEPKGLGALTRRAGYPETANPYEAELQDWLELHPGEWRTDLRVAAREWAEGWRKPPATESTPSAPAATEEPASAPTQAPTLEQPITASRPAEAPTPPEAQPTVAQMPTEAGLFGQVERPARAPEKPPEAPVQQPKLFDIQEGDLPGQTSIIDVVEATPDVTAPEPKTANRGEGLRAWRQKVLNANAADFHTWVRIGGGINPTNSGLEGELTKYGRAEHDVKLARHGKKRTSKRYRGSEALGPLVHEPGSNKGARWIDVLQEAFDEGWLPNKTGYADLDIGDLLDLLDRNPAAPGAVEQQVDEAMMREWARSGLPTEEDLASMPPEEAAKWQAWMEEEVIAYDKGIMGDPGAIPVRDQTTPPPDPLAMMPPIAPRLRGAATTEQAMPAPGKPISAPQVQQAFAAIVKAAGLHVPYRIGRLGRGRKRGIFKVDPEVIRVREANNIPTAAHETGHALEKALYGWPRGGPWKTALVDRGIQLELTMLGKELYGKTKPEGGYKREGWAEFVRLWLTEQATARQKVPELTRWFESTLLPQHADVASAISAAVAAVNQWQMQGPRARAEASVVDLAAPRERLRRMASEARRMFSKQAWIEMGEPLRQLTEEAEKREGRELKPSRDPYALYEALRLTHDARTERMVREAMIDLAGNRVGPSLEQALAPIRGKRNDFTLYLWGRQAQLYWNDPNRAEGRNPGLSREDADALVEELRSPKFELAEGMVRDWHSGVLNYAAQASPAFREVVERIHESHPGYLMPLQRVFDDLDSMWARAARRESGSATISSPVKRMRGSGRRIKEPFQAMITNARATLLKAHQRAVLDAVIHLSNVEGMGGLIEEVPHNQVPVASKTIQELIDTINRRLEPEFGLAIQGVEEEAPVDILGETLTFFAPAPSPRGKDPILPYWDGKSVRWYYVDGDLYRALMGMDIYRLPAIVHWTLGSTARTLRLGTTGLRASFGLVTNPTRDVQTLWMNSQSNWTAPHLFAEWMRQAALEGLHVVSRGKTKRSPEMELWLDLGGSIAQSLGQDIPHTRRAARTLFESPTQRALDPRNWVDFLRDLFQFPESVSRATEIAALKSQVGWTPGTPISLDQSLDMLRGGKHVTTDFTAAGEYGRAANQIIPFFNAAIQGPRAHIRAARHHPARFWFRGLQMAVGTLALWWMFKDEDWYKEMLPRERFSYWHFPVDGELVRVPRAFEVGAFFAALPEALADAWYRMDPSSATEWFSHMFEVVSPPMLPVPIAEGLEQTANKDFYSGFPIVPMGEQFKPPEEQYGEYTSRAAIMLGNLFKVSPRRIDHAIRGVFGGLGSDITDLLGLGPAELEREKEPADLPVVGRLFSRGGASPYRSKSVDRLYDTLSEYTVRQQSDRVEETKEQRQMRLQLDDARRAVSALSWVRAHTPSTEDRKKISAEIVRIAREAIEAERAGTVTRTGFQRERKRAERQKELAGGSGNR